MVNNSLISVIVPVYNVEKYLPYCLDSIIGQTYENIEIILINDGSSDNSPAICDEYARRDSRIKVIHKENQGVSAARNSGLDISLGDYITFADSDDILSPDCISVLYKTITEYDCDISAVDHISIFDYSDIVTDTSTQTAEICSQTEFIRMLLERKVICSCWGKLYKRSLFNRLRFPVGRVHAEDAWILYQTCFRADRIAVSPAVGYFYLIREGSAVQRRFDMKIYSSNVEINDEIMSDCERRYPQLRQLITADRLNLYLKMLYRIHSADNSRDFAPQREEMISRIRKYSKEISGNKDIGRNLKIKLAAFRISPVAFFIVQRLSDIIKQIKNRHRYVV